MFPLQEYVKRAKQAQEDSVKNARLDRNQEIGHKVLKRLPATSEAAVFGENPLYAFIRGYAEGLQGSFMGYFGMSKLLSRKAFDLGKTISLFLHYPFPEDL